MSEFFQWGWHSSEHHPSSRTSPALLPPPWCGRHGLNLTSIDILLLKKIEQHFNWAQKGKLALSFLNEPGEHFRKCWGHRLESYPNA